MGTHSHKASHKPLPKIKTIEPEEIPPLLNPFLPMSVADAKIERTSVDNNHTNRVEHSKTAASKGSSALAIEEGTSSSVDFSYAETNNDRERQAEKQATNSGENQLQHSALISKVISS